MQPFEITRGTSPVILAFPHTGTHVPEMMLQQLNANGRLLADTDWHVDRLYEGLLPGATSVRATFHRYVIDANRDPEGISLYPGQNTTGLVPLTDFDGMPIWDEPSIPDDVAIAQRLEQYHAPYHRALAAEIERVRKLHGIAVLYDCHSIRSGIPYLFSGKLPDFNIGTDTGRSCAPEFERSTAELTAAAAADGYTSIANGRFKGGWTTRHYGRPETGVHAIQMELAQSTYMVEEAPPFALDMPKARRLRVHLKAILERIEAVALDLKHSQGAAR
ncbi:formiminoglutamase [Hoeflea marina]|uniref:Formiminoglutamase n=1 Tax=Hoeflea marina TaxID=274592 RepID=A0A317PIS1_9HYPH|nr:formiminoglutamase [Hoeflea marina]